MDTKRICIFMFFIFDIVSVSVAVICDNITMSEANGTIASPAYPAGPLSVGNCTEWTLPRRDNHLKSTLVIHLNSTSLHYKSKGSKKFTKADLEIGGVRITSLPSGTCLIFQPNSKCNINKWENCSYNIYYFDDVPSMKIKYSINWFWNAWGPPSFDLEYKYISCTLEHEVKGTSIPYTNFNSNTEKNIVTESSTKDVYGSLAAAIIFAVLATIEAAALVVIWIIRKRDQQSKSSNKKGNGIINSQFKPDKKVDSLSNVQLSEPENIYEAPLDNDVYQVTSGNLNTSPADASDAYDMAQSHEMVYNELYTMQ
uniref:uncharacterized protein LOC120344218 n=1 Tax=Styela clava TaxID=7725 RepID=UPI0019395152|nr:uncharacterized protein LOC120344218 [Styela clava]